MDVRKWTGGSAAGVEAMDPEWPAADFLRPGQPGRVLEELENQVRYTRVNNTRAMNNASR